MADDSKGTAGLFKLKDLLEMKVEDQEVFPKPAELKVPEPPAEPPAEEAVAAEAMLDAIKRARTASQEAVKKQAADVQLLRSSAPPLQVRSTTLDNLAVGAQQLSDSQEQVVAATPFRTDAHQRVVKAIAADTKRTSRRSTVVLVASPVLAVAGLAALIFVLTRPPIVMDASLPVHGPALVELNATTEIATLQLIPVAPPVPEVDPEEEARLEAERERAERRDRRRQRRNRDRNDEEDNGQAIDRSNLF